MRSERTNVRQKAPPGGAS